MKLNRKGIAAGLVLSLSLCTAIFPVKSQAGLSASMPERAIEWAITTAEDDTHGYSMENRLGSPDYDCSSFVYSAFKEAGFKLTRIGTTSDMVGDFKKLGFEWVSWSSIGGTEGLMRGDILLNYTTRKHSEIYLGEGMLVGAHQSRGNKTPGDQTGTEVSVAKFFSQPWDGVLRYKYASPKPTDQAEPTLQCNANAEDDGLFTLTSVGTDGSIKTVSKKMIAYKIIEGQIYYVEYIRNIDKTELKKNPHNCYIKVRNCQMNGKKKKTLLKKDKLSGSITDIAVNSITYAGYENGSEILTDKQINF